MSGVQVSGVSQVSGVRFQVSVRCQVSGVGVRCEHLAIVRGGFKRTSTQSPHKPIRVRVRLGVKGGECPSGNSFDYSAIPIVHDEWMSRMWSHA